MAKFIILRVLSAIATLFVVITITFFLMNLIPGGPFLSEKAAPETMALMEKKYGLDQPLPIQYKNYMANLLRGDFGMSYKRKGYSVVEIIREKFPVSAKLGGLAIGISILLGIPMGIIAAYKRNSVIDRVLMFLCTVGISVPGFVVATFLLYTFGMRYKILPTLGLASWKNYIMPVMALSFSPTCYITRLTRSSMLDVIGQDYLKTARSKGLPESIVLFKHALRNSVIPVVTYLGPLTAAILTGSFVIESIFSVPGLGSYFITSINGRDYPMVMGTTIFLGMVLIAMNLIVDLLYSVIDPRIKYK